MTEDTKFPKLWLKPYTMIEEGVFVTRFIQTGNSETIVNVELEDIIPPSEIILAKELLGE